MQGARIALLEARRESELASLVRRHGGEPVCAPALMEVERDFGVELAAARAALGRGGAAIVFTTGVGLERVLRIADAQGGGEELRADLARSTIVCRGPKPIAVLKREGLPVHVRAESPHTTRELVAALDGVPVAGRDVVFVHDGGASGTAVDALRARGARLLEVQPYEWALPADLAPLHALIEATLGGRIDALAITTQIQARHLFAVARAMGAAEALGAALRDRVVVGAVGPTSAQALVELGVPPHVVPTSPKMGA